MKTEKTEEGSDPPLTQKLASSLGFWSVAAILVCLLVAILWALRDGSSPHPLDGVEDELRTEVFRVPPDFLRVAASGSAEDDPFADLDGARGKPRRRLTAREILEEAGIEFPRGATVMYGAPTSQLIVRNTHANLNLIESFVQRELFDYPVMIQFRIRIYDVPNDLASEILESASEVADQDRELAKLEDWVTDKKARPAAVLSCDTRSGERTKIGSSASEAYVVDYALKDGVVRPEVRTEEIGTVLEIDAVIGADQQTVDVRFWLTHDTAPPSVQKSFVSVPSVGREYEIAVPTLNRVTIDNGVTMLAGTSRILGAGPTAGNGSQPPTTLIVIATAGLVRVLDPTIR